MLKKQRNFLRMWHAKTRADGVHQNPFFLKVVTARWKKILIGIGIVCVAVGGMIGATYIPAFQIRSIDISGTILIDQNSVRSFVFDHMNRTAFPLCSPHFFLFLRTRSLGDSLKTQFPIEDARIEKVGDALTISIVERITTIVLKTKEKTVMLDISGAFVRDATEEESREVDGLLDGDQEGSGEKTLLQTDVPILVNTENDGVTELSSARASAIVTLAKELPRSGFAVRMFEIGGLAAPFVTVHLESGVRVYVDLATSTIDAQMRALRAVVDSTTVSPAQEYIDVRFGSYVYKK